MSRCVVRPRVDSYSSLISIQLPKSWRHCCRKQHRTVDQTSHVNYKDSTNVHGVLIIGSKQVVIPLGSVCPRFHLIMRADFSICVRVFSDNALFLSPLPLFHLISLRAFHL